MNMIHDAQTPVPFFLSKRVDTQPECDQLNRCACALHTILDMWTDSSSSLYFVAKF